MKLIVGLGNPGTQYARHRHNVGFLALDRIADRLRLGGWRKRFQGETVECEIAGHRCILLKPQTFMNESGRAVGEAARFLKIEPDDVIVLHDELDLVPGKLKVKAGGGNAGHNGLRSTSQHIGNEFVRLRIGIGHPGHKDLVHGHVLHDFARQDEAWLDPLLDAIADALPHLVLGDQGRFMTEFARLTRDEDCKDDAASPKKAAKESKVPPPPEPDAKSPPPPPGERAGKRQSALAENLKKWLKGRTD
jgi:peptidyl-tRNA hydrolase, PTH1 family